MSIEAQKKFVDKLVELTNIVKRVQGTAKVKVIKSLKLYFLITLFRKINYVVYY